MSNTIIMYESGKAVGGEGHPTNADEITFNNEDTDLVSTNVQDAIDEIVVKVDDINNLFYVRTITLASQSLPAGQTLPWSAPLAVIPSGYEFFDMSIDNSIVNSSAVLIGGSVTLSDIKVFFHNVASSQITDFTPRIRIRCIKTGYIQNV